MFLKVDDITQPIEEWAADYGIPVSLIRSRLRRGWSVERAVTDPMRVRKGQKLSAGHKRGTLEFKGERLNRKQWAKRLGISKAAFQHRLNNPAWTAEEVFSQDGRSERRVTYQGEILTIREWAERFGLTPACLRLRLDAGWPLKRAMHERMRVLPGKAPRMIEHAGKALSVKEWAAELGIAQDTIRSRLANPDWTLEQALTPCLMRGQRRDLLEPA